MDQDLLGDFAVRLITIEKLLIMLLSDQRYKPVINDVRSQLYADYGDQLNRLFPSDPEYQAVQSIVNNMNSALDAIERNIDVLDIGGAG